MRISSLSFYQSTLSGMQDQQSSIARLSQQIATEKKYLAPKDAPLETATVMQLADKISMRSQYQSNQLKAENTLKEENTVLDEFNAALSSIRGLLVGAGISQDAATRSVLAEQLNAFYDQIRDLANHRDSAGNYIFAGYQTDTQPYTHDALFDGGAGGGTLFAGDAGQREAEIDANRYIATNDSLETVMATGTADDLLSTLDALATGLQAVTATQADIDNAFSIVINAQDNLSVIQAGVAGRLSAIEQSRDSVNTFLLTDQNALATLTEIDKTAAIIELQMRKTALEAAQSSFGLTSKQSLFNYL